MRALAERLAFVFVVELPACLPVRLLTIFHGLRPFPLRTVYGICYLAFPETPAVARWPATEGPEAGHAGSLRETGAFYGAPVSLSLRLRLRFSLGRWLGLWFRFGLRFARLVHGSPFRYVEAERRYPILVFCSLAMERGVITTPSPYSTRQVYSVGLVHYPLGRMLSGVRDGRRGAGRRDGGACTRSAVCTYSRRFRPARMSAFLCARRARIAGAQSPSSPRGMTNVSRSSGSGSGSASHTSPVISATSSSSASPKATSGA